MSSGFSYRRAAWWLLGGAVIGMVVLYNLLRVGGSTPQEAGLVSLVAGGLAGLVGAAVVIGVLDRKRGFTEHGPPARPAPEALTGDQRDILLILSPLAAATAVAGTVAAILMVKEFADADATSRPTSALVLAAWYALLALWFGIEAVRSQRGLGDGAETMPLGAEVTCVVAGIGISLDFVTPLQVILIGVVVLAGVAAAIAAWRLHGARGLPWSAALVPAVGAAALLLSLTV